MPTLRENIAYKGILTFSNYVLNFVTFPYVTRVLGPSGFGTVDFVNTSVDYFILFATMGIITIGTREIAFRKNDAKELSIAFSNILGTNIVFTISVLFIYLISVLLIPEFRVAKELFYIGSAKIIFTALAVEWFFTGIENFRFITIRSVIIKIFYVIGVFLFIRYPSDYILYFILTILAFVINSLVNFIYANRLIKIQYNHLFTIVYYKSNLKLGSYAIMTSMYISFNVMYLGLVTNNLQVAYYSVAVKLYFIFLNLFSAFTSVMIPRMSALASKSEKTLFNHYLNKSFDIVGMLAIPLIIWSSIMAPEIIEIISGWEYASSIIPMRILMPALLFVWISQVIALQCFIPYKQDTLLLKASIIGGLLALVLNVLITRNLGAVGSSIVLLSCEVVVTMYYCINAIVKKYISIGNIRNIVKGIYIAIPIMVVCFVAKVNDNIYISFLISIVPFSFYCIYKFIKYKLQKSVG